VTDQVTERAPARAADRTWLVAAAAALWGTDALLRQPLAGHLPAATVVFWEHLIIVVVLVPWLPAALRALRAATARERWALVGIGAGASAVATVLFTQALQLGDPITPLVLQKLQPVLVIVVATALLGERLRPGYWVFAAPALVGAWLMAFADPFDVHLRAATAALLAIAAAALWAFGTVLGRLVSARMASRDVTVLRFAIGLPAAFVVLVLEGAPVAVSGAQIGPLVALALIPGLLGLALYYVGLKATAASRATLAELAFPVTAALIGVTVLGASLSATQWLGLVVVVASVTALGLRERSERPVVAATAP
jgi:DME family drug/metabolite transporter